MPAHAQTASTPKPWVPYVVGPAITLLWVVAVALSILADLFHLGVGGAAALTVGMAATVSALWFLGVVRAEGLQGRAQIADRQQQIVDTLDAIAGQVTHLTATHQRAEAGRHRIVEDLAALRLALVANWDARYDEGFADAMDALLGQEAPQRVLRLPATRQGRASQSVVPTT